MTSEPAGDAYSRLMGMIDQHQENPFTPQHDLLTNQGVISILLTSAATYDYLRDTARSIRHQLDFHRRPYDPDAVFEELFQRHQDYHGL